jgi:hypothetical protein
MSWTQKPRLDLEGLRERPYADVIFERPPSKRAKVEKKLREMKTAEEDKANAKLLEAGDYAKVVMALRNERNDPDRLNNLGYAYAWLAARQPYEPYWGRAIDAFVKSAKAAKASEDEAADEEKEHWEALRDRAQDNLGAVREARRLG